MAGLTERDHNEALRSSATDMRPLERSRHTRSPSLFGPSSASGGLAESHPVQDAVLFLLANEAHSCRWSGKPGCRTMPQARQVQMKYALVFTLCLTWRTRNKPGAAGNTVNEVSARERQFQSPGDAGGVTLSTRVFTGATASVSSTSRNPTSAR
jgi:hypothetical protein